MNHPDDIDLLLQGTIELPSLPDAVVRLSEQLDDPLCSMTTVAQTLAGDPALAIKALRLVNSAYYAVGQEVKTIEHAAVLLGVRPLKNLAMTAAVLDAIGEEAETYIRHCLACGVAMRALHHATPLGQMLGSPDEAFLLGLLHDIGKVVLGECVPEHFEMIAQAAAAEGIPWYRAEQALLRIDHAALGGRLAEKWKLPPAAAHGIAAHHDPDAAPQAYRSVAAYLALANYLCNAAGLVAVGGSVRELPDAVWPHLHLDGPGLVAVTHEFFDALPAVDTLMGFAGAPRA